MDMDKTAIGIMDMGEKTQMVAEPQSNATQMAMNVECPVCHTPNPPSETYCIDCGFLLSSAPVGTVDMPEPASYGKLITTDGTREFPLNLGENSVGRENADVLLSHNTVSRSHARITVSETGVSVEDNGSTNGTYVAGKKIAPGEKTELTNGCEVVFGSLTLKFEAPQQAAEETSEDSAQERTVQISEPEAGADSCEAAAEPAAESAGEQIAEDAPEEAVEEAPAEEVKPAGMLISKDGSISLPIKEGINTIGRRDGNDIIIPDPYCSGKHAELAAESGKFTLTDIGSTNGTMVNGVKLDANAPRELQPGDEITLGRTAFRIEVM